MFKEEPNFEPELGQMILSNNQFFVHEAYWATDGLILLRSVLQESKVLEWENTYDYEGKVFAYRNYCWCDGDLHEEGCPPNFEYYSKDIKITWYKHEGRGITANIKEPKAIEWFDIIADCVKEIREYDFS